jgi:PAS domain S-box-containing protein
LDVVNGRLSWSDEVYRIFGLQPQEFGATYEAFLAAVHPDDRKAVDAIFTASLNAGKPSYEATHRVVRRGTGEVRWVHEKCEFVSDANGRVIRAVGMVHDTTESKRAEEALRHASDQHRLALAAAGLGAWDYNLGTGEMVWDQRSRGMFGVPVDGPITYDRAVQCVHPEDRAAVEAAVKQALAWPGGAYHLEFRVVWPDGSVRWVDAHGRAQFEVEGGSYRAVRLVGVNADITDRKRAEESFYGAQKLESIGLLAGGIAHDFNNLLVGVVGNASLAEDLLPRGSPVVEILRRIIRSGEQAAHLTNQLLAYAGKGRFVVEPVNLSTLIQQGRALVQGSIPENIRLTLQLETSLPSVESDSSLVQQMFMNLALNAAEAIGDNSGVIAVTTGEMSVDAAYIEAELNDWPIEPGRCVFLEVRDNGCGMNAATKAKIFDPFFTTKFQGRGLGLAAVAGVVRAHKGAIKLTTAPGAGATFRVLLPAMASESVPSAPAAREDDPRGQNTVLVVDDEEMVRDVARRALERYGYEVLVAATGPAAIEIVRSHARRIRLVLLDLSMPGMSGKETLACLREVKPDLDVIISSGYSEAETLQRFDGIPLSGLIQKPYTVQQLARKVKAALG